MAELQSFLDQTPDNLPQAISALRLHILNEGIPSDTTADASLRTRIWSILLSVSPIETDAYLSLLERGPSPAYQKIRNDTFRTLATDPIFKNKVSELSLIRILNAYAWRQVDKPTPTNASRDNSDIPYVQGMNILAAPFLYVCKSEVQAFGLYETWISREIPLYVHSSLAGVHMGVKLIDKALKRLDSKLYFYLRTKGLSAELYAFPSVMTLSACTPPLQEVLVLWDFLIAYGPHMNILCIIAQLIMMREQLMSSASPMSLLRKFPAMRAEKIKPLAISFLTNLGEDLYAQLARHCWDETLMKELKD